MSEDNRCVDHGRKGAAVAELGLRQDLYDDWAPRVAEHSGSFRERSGT